VLLRLPADTALFFLRDERANLSSLRRAGENCRVEIALIKSNSSCLSLLLRQEPLYTMDLFSST
jgi:hypothetical protein